MTAARLVAHRPSMRAVGITTAVGSALVSASTGPVMKPLLEAGWSLGAAMLIRMTCAGLVLSPWLARAIIRNPRFLQRHWLLIVGFGLTGVAGAQLFYLSAMQRMPVGMALLIMYLAPVLLVGWIWIMTRRRPSWTVIGGTVVATIGLVLAADVTSAEFDLLGVAFALASAGCLAAYFALAEKSGGSIPPLALASGGLLSGALLTGALRLVGVLPFVALPITVHYDAFAVPWFIGIAWVALVTTAAAYGLGVIAVPMTGARLASFIGLTEILFVVACAWILLHETPTPIQAVGGVLILMGVILVRLDPPAPGNPREEVAIVPTA